jgi:hypothetical protein
MISILAEFVHDWASAGVRRGVELLSATAGAIFILHRRTFYRTVRTKDTAVAWLRTQQRLTINAFIEKLARVDRHRLALRESANRAHEHRFKKNFAHTRFQLWTEDG